MVDGGDCEIELFEIELVELDDGFRAVSKEKFESAGSSKNFKISDFFASSFPIE